ncbi:MAG: HIRAN domain-containing protein [Saprospiraceae bacterium]|nr:HIRAN domain-containing protein [Saprospiraceae bacterium]
MNRIAFLKNMITVGLAGGLQKLLFSKDKKFSEKKELYHSYVYGTQYYSGISLIPQMQEGESLTLIREPDNSFDECAIAIHYQNTKLGYISMDDNDILSRMMDIGHGHFTSEISDINLEAPEYPLVGFRIYSHQ